MGMFTETEREELRTVLGEEMRVLGMLDVPCDTRLPLPVDDEAEEQLIALAREGHVAKISPKEFGRSLYGMLFLLLATCYANHKQPTTARILWLLHHDGWNTTIDQDIRRLLDEVPVRMTPNVAVRRVQEAARRRRMLEHVTSLDVLLRAPQTPNETIARALQSLIGVAHGD